MLAKDLQFIEKKQVCGVFDLGPFLQWLTDDILPDILRTALNCISLSAYTILIQ